MPLLRNDVDTVLLCVDAHFDNPVCVIRYEAYTLLTLQPSNKFQIASSFLELGHTTAELRTDFLHIEPDLELDLY